MLRRFVTRPVGTKQLHALSLRHASTNGGRRANTGTTREQSSTQIDSAGLSPRLIYPSRQSHLRGPTRRVMQANEDTPTDAAEDALRQNAFNLVMKLLYGKLALGDVSGTQRLLNTPPAVTEEGGADGLAHIGDAHIASLKAACNGSFTSIRDAGMFAKTFLRQQKAIWYEYDKAMARLREERAKGSSNGSRKAQTENISQGRDINALLSVAMPTEGPATYFARGGRKASVINTAPSDLLARLYARKAAKAQLASERLRSVKRRGASSGEEGVGDDVPAPDDLSAEAVALRAAAARERIVELLTPEPRYAHGTDGCSAAAFVSFTDMLTNGGLYYVSDSPDSSHGPGEDLFVASHFAVTGSRTLSADRLAAMKRQYAEQLPGLRYLYAPPGMLVRGYAAAVTTTGERVVVLEATEQWEKRCFADVINFERFCLAKVSASSLLSLTSRLTKRADIHDDAGKILNPTNPDHVLIMSLFLQYRGLPSAPRVGTTDALRRKMLSEPQHVVNVVTQMYAAARKEGNTRALPVVEGRPVAAESVTGSRGSAIVALADLDNVIRSTPQTAPWEYLCCRPEATTQASSHNSIDAAADEEVKSVMEAYRQQTMFLRKQSAAFSPGLLGSAGVRGVAEDSASSSSAQLATAAAKKARTEGMHAYDAATAVLAEEKTARESQKARASKKNHL